MLDFDKKTGLIDANGKIIIPFQYASISSINDRYFSVTVRFDAHVETKIIDVQTGEVLFEKLPYASFKPYPVCGFNQQASLLQGKQVIDEKFKPLTEVHSSISSTGNYLIGADNNIPNIGYQQKLYDCSGEVVSFTINGQKVDAFKWVKVIDKNLIHVYLPNQTGYFINLKGETIPFNYPVLAVKSTPFKELLAIEITKDSERLIIDRKGNTILPRGLKYVRVDDPTSNVFAFVDRNENYYGLFSLKGELINGQLYDGLTYLGLGLYRVKRGKENNKKIAVITSKGQIIIPFHSYSRVVLERGIIIARKGENLTYYDRLGNSLK